MAALKKTVARKGLNPMGDKDELVKLLVDCLKSEQRSSAPSGGMFPTSMVQREDLKIIPSAYASGGDGHMFWVHLKTD